MAHPRQGAKGAIASPSLSREKIDFFYIHTKFNETLYFRNYALKFETQTLKNALFIAYKYHFFKIFPFVSLGNSNLSTSFPYRLSGYAEISTVLILK